MNTTRTIKRHTVAYFLALWLCFLPLFAMALTPLSSGQVGGKAFVLMEEKTGILLAEYRAHERLAPASITKLMTAYVVYESLKKGLIALSDKTAISAHAREMTEGSRMFLEKGSHVSIDDLLSGLVIQSGNDAAVALAEAVAGDEARFVVMMNQAANKLGMQDSHFKNVTGLTEEGHYMSAYDIALLARAIIREFAQHYPRYSQTSFTWNGIKQDNRNALLKIDPSVDGLKTGYTEAAGYCLTTSAKRGNLRLISVVLGTESVNARVKASKTLLDYGFLNFAMEKIFQAGAKAATASVKDGAVQQVDLVLSRDVELPVAKEGDKHQFTIELAIQEAEAPIQKGEVLGQMKIAQEGKVIASIDLKSANAVEEIGLLKRIWRNTLAKISSWF